MKKKYVKAIQVTQRIEGEEKETLHKRYTSWLFRVANNAISSSVTGVFYSQNSMNTYSTCSGCYKNRKL